MYIAYMGLYAYTEITRKSRDTCVWQWYDSNELNLNYSIYDTNIFQIRYCHTFHAHFMT